MKNNALFTKKLLDKVSLSEDLPSHVKKHILKSRRKALVKILKHKKKYNFTIATAILVYFFFKKAGITLSILHSFIVFATVSVFSIGIISSSVYIGVKKYTAEITENNNVSTPTFLFEKKNTITSSQQPIKEKNKSKIINSIKFKNRIKIKKILSTNLSDQKVKTIKNILSTSLKKQRLSYKSNSQNVLLYGSIEKLKNNIIISIRAVNEKDGEVIFLNNYQSNEKDLKFKIKNIARDISNNVE